MNFILSSQRNGIYLCQRREIMGRLIQILRTDSEEIEIYSPKYDGEEDSEFEKFLKINGARKEPQLRKFFDAIVSAVDKIREVGARENLFRPEGRRIKALPLFISSNNKIDKKIGKMRLYCLRYSEKILILGNGGVSTLQKYENDVWLNKCVNDLRIIDKIITKELKRIRKTIDDKGAIKEVIENIDKLVVSYG